MTTRSDQRRRTGMTVGVLVVLLLVVASTGLVTFYTDLLWFKQMNQSGVFWTILASKWGTGTAFAIVSFILIYVNVLIARRLAPRIALRPVMDSGPMEVDEAIRRIRSNIEPYLRLVLVGGNHDAWGGPFLKEKIGIELADGPIELEMAGHRALVAHGDGVGPGDLGYKMLKGVIRSRPFRGFMRWIHPDVAWGIANRVSRTSDREAHGFARAKQRASILEAEAVRLLEERPDLDLVVFGHSHTPAVKSVGDRRFYVNSGDWIVHRTYTVVTEAGVEQLEWEGGGAEK